MMRKSILLIATICVMAAVNVALADTDTIRGINIDFVNIGNAGNGTDPATGNLYGAVGYNYRIGKYEITNAQWNAFTAAAGAPTGNDGGYAYSASYGAQQPTNYVSWYEAVQFCNYLTSGDKSKGAYLFSGNNANPGDFLGIDRVAAQATYGTIYFLPTEDEWYKAAYYKPDGSGYSTYANGLNTPPGAGVDTNYDNVTGQPWDVGVGNGTMEQNGTFDMMGNVWEWNETKLYDSLPYRGIHGGMFSSTDAIWDLSSYRQNGTDPDDEYEGLGFRIASVPEPAIAATVDIHPDTLNLQSKGKWITCYIAFPEDANVADVNSSTILLNDQVKAEWTMIEEEAQVLMAKFSRSAVEDILQPGIVELTVSGKLNDGTRFEGKDTITVINKGKP